jgi:predicted RNA-binding Zn ribbon-like protein
MAKQETVADPTSESMRLDGGHPALELVNTVYGQVGGPVEHDVLATPRDLVVLARRLGLADDASARPAASAAALRAARTLRDALDTVLRALLTDAPSPRRARAVVEDAARAAFAAGRLEPRGNVLAWTWPARNPFTPVHRLAVAAVDLLTDDAVLSRLHCCAACCWLFIDRSRGPGRRWCSMADCGSNAKKRRYVETRRKRRAASGARSARDLGRPDTNTGV